MTSRPAELVFVHGPLRRGGPDAFRMEGAELLDCGDIEAKLYDAFGEPALVLVQDSGWVTGEFYRVTPEHLARLDDYHGLNEAGCPRRRARVVGWRHVAKDSTVWAWEWIALPDGAILVQSGNWWDRLYPRVAPWFTWVAALCLGFLPAGLIAGIFVPRSAFRYPGSPPSNAAQALGTAFSMLAILAPFAGLGAVYFAFRRREGWTAFRYIILVLLVLACAMLLHGFIRLAMSRLR